MDAKGAKPIALETATKTQIARIILLNLLYDKEKITLQIEY
jgi:hypothetical protein